MYRDEETWRYYLRFDEDPHLSTILALSNFLSWTFSYSLNKYIMFPEWCFWLRSDLTKGSAYSYSILALRTSSFCSACWNCRVQYNLALSFQGKPNCLFFQVWCNAGLLHKASYANSSVRADEVLLKLTKEVSKKARQCGWTVLNTSTHRLSSLSKGNGWLLLQQKQRL